MNASEESACSPESAPDAPSPLSLSLVIPAFNEGQRLAAGVSRLRDAVACGALSPENTEFVLVDDGSTDDTTARAAALFATYPHVRLVRLADNRGKGAAVRAGVAVASARLIVFADADMAIDPAQTPQFVGALADADLAIGSRSASGASVNRPSLQRSIMNRAFNQLVNTLTNVSLSDTQCGFKAFRAPIAKILFHCTVTDRFAFDVEVLSLARRLGMSVAEVPVHWLRVKGSQIRPWADARSMARDVYRAGRGPGTAPPLPALTVTVDGEPTFAAESTLTALQGGLAPGLPVLRREHGRVSVLCPLMSESEIEATAARIVSLCPGVLLERATISVAQLCELAPLSLLWDDDPILPTVAKAPQY